MAKAEKTAAPATINKTDKKFALVFSFDDLSSKDKAVKKIQKEFAKMGTPVAQVDVTPTVKRIAGIGYREVSLTFADSQVVVFKVKKTGDIFQVKLNKKEVPIKAQDNQMEALKEIVGMLDRGRTAFQQKMAKTKVVIPTGLKSTVQRKEVVLKDKKTALLEAIAAGKKQIEQLKSDNQKLNTEIATLQAQLVGTGAANTGAA